MSHFSDEMSSAIDAGKKVTNEQLGEQIEAKLEDLKFWRKLEMGEGVSTSLSVLMLQRTDAGWLVVQDWVWRLVLQSDYSVWRQLRSQALGTDGRSTTQGWCHPLFAWNPLQVVL